jgi:hypothetical protein
MSSVSDVARARPLFAGLERPFVKQRVSTMRGSKPSPSSVAGVERHMDAAASVRVTMSPRVVDDLAARARDACTACRSDARGEHVSGDVARDAIDALGRGGVHAIELFARVSRRSGGCRGFGGAHELLEAERFDEVLGSAHEQRSPAIVDGRPRADEHRVRTSTALVQARQELEAGDVRQRELADQDVGRAELERGFGARRDAHVVSAPAQHGGDRGCDRSFVVDDEDAQRLGVHA